MFAYHDLTGPVVARLDPNNPSQAYIDSRQLESGEVLTATQISLNLQIAIPNWDIELTLPEPLVLELSDPLVPNLFTFHQIGHIQNLNTQVPISFADSEITVTPRTKGLAINRIDMSQNSISFSIRRNAMLNNVTGPWFWYVHNPLDSYADMAFGFVEFENESNQSKQIYINLEQYEGLSDSEELLIETVATQDPRHIWSSVQLFR